MSTLTFKHLVLIMVQLEVFVSVGANIKGGRYGWALRQSASYILYWNSGLAHSSSAL